jgi:hypothetical protein
MADAQDPAATPLTDTPLFIHCSECGDDITIQNPQAYILAVHVDGYCEKTVGWLHQGE